MCIFLYYTFLSDAVRYLIYLARESQISGKQLTKQPSVIIPTQNVNSASDTRQLFQELNQSIVHI